jgi:hypothetical protein
MAAVSTIPTEKDFTVDAGAALARLADIDEKARPMAYRAVTEALREAVLGGRLTIARDLTAWLRSRSSKVTSGEAEANLAERAILVLREPGVAQAHATNLLDGKIERSEEALAMLRESGPLGVQALIDARSSRTPSLEQRAQFVATLRSVGAPALSAILSTLEPLAALTTRQDEALAEDLLRAIPDNPSDAVGEVTVRFVRLDKPVLGVAALRATTMLWGKRARPLLIGVLDASDDGFRTAALEELQKLGCIDNLVVERLGRLLNGQKPASDELKIAAATSLASTSPEARPRAIALLTGRLSSGHGLMGSLRSALGGGTRDDTRVGIALARSLHKLDPTGSRGLLERFANSRPELRVHVDAILAGR